MCACISLTRKSILDAHFVRMLFPYLTRRSTEKKALYRNLTGQILEMFCGPDLRSKRLCSLIFFVFPEDSVPLAFNIDLLFLFSLSFIS